MAQGSRLAPSFSLKLLRVPEATLSREAVLWNGQSGELLRQIPASKGDDASLFHAKDGNVPSVPRALFGSASGGVLFSRHPSVKFDEKLSRGYLNQPCATEPVIAPRPDQRRHWNQRKHWRAELEPNAHSLKQEAGEQKGRPSYSMEPLAKAGFHAPPLPAAFGPTYHHFVVDVY